MEKNDDKLNKTSSSKTRSNITSDNTNNSFFYYDYIEIQVGDPISSLLLNDKHIIIGTMMGKIILFCFNSENQKIFYLSKDNNENISGLSFIEESNTLFASIGDEKILSYNLNNTLYNNIAFKTTYIYDNHREHDMYCDNAYILMSKENLLKIDLFNPDFEETIKDDVYFNYKIISFTNEPKKNGKIKSTNYYVPLDYDGEYFCWVEYLNDKEDRNLCVQLLTQSETNDNVKFKFKIDKQYGHISHAKIFEGKIIIVHDLNKCEIRKIDKKFELIESFTHIGDEVYAIDILYHENTNFSNEDLNDNNYNVNKGYLEVNVKNNLYESYTNNENKIKMFGDLKFEKHNYRWNKLPKIDNRNKNCKIANSIELKSDSLKLVDNKLKKKKYKDLNQILTIITLDIDGNVNKYENGIEEKIFNLYDIKEIDKDHKDKKFFNMGYVYFIKTDLNYFCITTDFGCYIIKRND